MRECVHVCVCVCVCACVCVCVCMCVCQCMNDRNVSVCACVHVCDPKIIQTKINHKPILCDKVDQSDPAQHP